MSIDRFPASTVAHYTPAALLLTIWVSRDSSDAYDRLGFVGDIDLGENSNESLPFEPNCDLLQCSHTQKKLRLSTESTRIVACLSIHKHFAPPRRA